MTYRQVPVNYALTWIKCSIKIASTQYSLFLGVGLLCTLAPVLASLIPIIGPIAGSLLGFTLSLGLMRLTQKVMNRETVTFENFINMTFEARIFQQFQTYLIIIGIASLVVALSRFELKYLSAPLGFLTGFISWFCVYATFDDLDKGSTEPINFNNVQSRLMPVFHTLMGNFLPILVAYVLFGLFASVCFILCVAPFFLLYIPMAAPVNFLMFSSIFRGMDMDQELAKWTVIAEGKSAQ